MRIAAILTLTAALALAACNSTPTETLPEENVVTVENVTENTEAVVEAPVANETAAAAPAAPAPGFTDDEQMRDDADATGMTARLPEDAAPPSANETVPVR